MQPEVVAVIGMHRSGTSVLTRALAVLGVDLGDRLGPAGAANPRGFFEDADIQGLNENILRAQGRDWHSLAPLAAASTATAPPGAEELARALLSSKLRRSGRLGLKDPRFCLLLPFWQRIFIGLGVRRRYVLAVRNPRSVADSLAARDGFGREKSYYLWLGHMATALSHLEGAPWIAVDYDRLLLEPGRELIRLAAGLGLPLAPEEFERFTSEFLSAGLRHSCYGLLELAADPAAPPQAVELFRGLQTLASGGCGPSAELLGGIQAHLAASAAALRAWDAGGGGTRSGVVRRARHAVRRFHRAARARRLLRRELRRVRHAGPPEVD